MEDTFKHKGLRSKLVEGLRRKGIKDTRVLEAINNVPRHFFLESFLDIKAYEDKALPIDVGQTISQPYTVAFQTELLRVEPGDKILEVGTGSGYQTAILIELGAKVYTIERQRVLYEKTRKLLPELGFNPQFFYGDGYEGKPTYGPFDKVLITAGAPFVPEALLHQLKVGGLLVAPIGDTDTQIMTLIRKVDANKFQKEEHGYFVFVPMLKGIEK